MPLNQLTASAYKQELGAFQMGCPEQLRLEQLYEAALRRWAHFSTLTQGEGTYLAEEIRRRAIEERG